ncbi:MAG: DUF1573 domain-containing protein [Planctomycetes bacterium]|nr:DUF1573 domain-containing protein [Planctomycetota bacterium]
MSRPPVLITLLGLVLLVTACGDQAERPADYRGPIARVVEQSRDLGELFAGARAEAVYEIENRGQAPLTILGSEASCGCTKPVFDRQTAAPGERIRLTVKVEAPALNARLRKRILVFTDDPHASRLELEVAMTCLGNAVLSATQFDLGDCAIGPEPLRRRIDLRLPPGLELVAIEARYEAPFIRLERVGPAALDLVVERPWQTLVLRDYLDFQLVAADPEGHQRRLHPQGIQLEGRIEPAPAFSPSRLDFGWLAADEEKCLGLEVPTGYRPVAPPAGIEVLPGPEPGRFLIKLRPGAVGALRERLRFEDASGRCLRLPVFAMRVAS